MIVAVSCFGDTIKKFLRVALCCVYCIVIIVVFHFLYVALKHLAVFISRGGTLLYKPRRRVDCFFASEGFLINCDR